MKTSWLEAEQIDAYLAGKLSVAQALIFEANLILDDDLHDKLRHQQQVHGLIAQYSRRQLRVELEHIHQQLFCSPGHSSFANRVRSFFLKNK